MRITNLALILPLLSAVACDDGADSSFRADRVAEAALDGQLALPEPGKGCPDGQPPVQCFVDPCEVSSCDVKGATCVADYCGGCFAHWVDEAGEPVCDGGSGDAGGEDGPDPVCPDGEPPVQCFADPCTVTTCDVKGATCEADYCGGCNAVWTDGDGNPVCDGNDARPGDDAGGEDGPDTDVCPDGEPPVQCFADPCTVTTCDVKGATCEADYCGGCNAIWTDGDGNTVCDGSDDGGSDDDTCPKGVPVVQCFADPCTVATCEVKGATCEANYCGGCNAVWADSEGNTVCDDAR